MGAIKRYRAETAHQSDHNGIYAMVGDEYIGATAKDPHGQPLAAGEVHG
jgi:hypothetical protein